MIMLRPVDGRLNMWFNVPHVKAQSLENCLRFTANVVSLILLLFFSKPSTGLAYLDGQS